MYVEVQLFVKLENYFQNSKNLLFKGFLYYDLLSVKNGLTVVSVAPINIEPKAR